MPSECSGGKPSIQKLPNQLSANPHASLGRLAAGTTIPKETEQNDILAQQRLHRPVGPHLAIYKAQITWYLSALNRITGLIVSGAFYAFGGLYLIAPYAGFHMESAVIAASFGAWPWIAKFMVKLSLALPFTFHSFNGVRHLVWDTASMITNKKVQQSGWFVVGLSVVSALALAVM